MKRSVWKSLLLVCLSQYCTRTVAAPTVQLFDNPFRQGHGGEFKAVIQGSGIAGRPGGTSVSTFCLEKNDSIDFGTSYYVQLRTMTVGSSPTGYGRVYDEPDPRTDWLYPGAVLLAGLEPRSLTTVGALGMFEMPLN